MMCDHFFMSSVPTAFSINNLLSALIPTGVDRLPNADRSQDRKDDSLDCVRVINHLMPFHIILTHAGPELHLLSSHVSMPGYL